MTQEITVLNKQVRLKQAENGFRTSMDSVMLAAACPVKKGQELLDMGCGVGSAGLCVLKRIDGVLLTGIDIQADHVAIAVENAEMNNMQERSEFLCSDIRGYKKEKGYHQAICNPPYLETGAHLRSPSEAKATAMGHSDDLRTKDWVENGYRLLRPEGSLTMVHEAGKLDKILQAMEGRFGAIDVIPLWPKHGTPAKRVIVRAIKGRKSPVRIHSGLVLHDEDGGYTVEAEGILREAKGLIL
ncbi:MAG: methyltransferase [Alphaproteobacteria bacterium]|nr:methyltransferase [Alphaproteobacteria bacterium]